MRHVLVALFALVAAPALAEGRFALVLAAGDYDHLRDLANPGNDARAIEDRLTELGFKVTLETDRDARRTRRALEDFAEDAEGADLALVYYAGHGVEIAGTNHLLPTDADASSVDALAATAIPLAEVVAALTAIAPTAILLVDACRDDPFSGIPPAADGRSAAPLDEDVPQETRAIAPGFARVGRADGLLYGFATSPGLTAMDGRGDHSPYAEALLRHLGKPGLSLPTVLTLVAQDVYDRTGTQQLPYFESALPELVFVTGEPAILSERDALLLSMAGMTPDLRDEVEATAAAHGTPLAPLYAALLSADLATLGPDQRHAALTEAAEAYSAFQARVDALTGNDPRITQLRDEAAELMALGAYNEAMAKYDGAAEISRRNLDTAEDALVANVTALVETLSAGALAARANLDYATAIGHYREIADQIARVEPFGIPFELAIARTNALWDMGSLLLLMGETAGAAAAYEEWALIAAERVDASDYNADFRRDLAIAVSQMGRMAQEQGKLGRAEELHQWALDLRWELVQEDYNNTIWLRDLSISYQDLGDVRIMQGDLAGAAQVFEGGLYISQTLAGLEPDNSEHQRDIQVSQTRIGNVRLAQGDLAGAGAAYDEALRLAADLAAAAPADPQRQRDLALSYNSVGDLALMEGRVEAAEEAFLAALEIVLRLSTADPQNLVFLRDVSISHNRLGDTRAARGDMATAEADYLAALQIARDLADRAPDHPEWQRDLAIALGRLSDLRAELGDTAGAVSYQTEVMELRAALVEQEPQNAQWRRDLAISHTRTGDFELAGDDAEAAEASYQAAIEIVRDLARLDPGNADWQRDLVVNLNKIGDALMTQGRAEEAASYFEDSLKIAKALAARDPANTLWMRDLAIGYSRTGDALLALDDIAGAKTAYEAAFDLYQRLTELRPGLAVSWTDLVLAHYKISQTAPDRRPPLEAALALAQRLMDEGRLPFESLSWIEELQAELAALPPLP